MSNDMIPFQQAQVPSFLSQSGMTPEQAKAMNAAAATGTGGGGLNKISLKQSRFRMVVGGQESVIPSMDLQLVIVRVNDGLSKTWFEKAWNPNEEAGMPECSSDDGIAPRADAPKPQSTRCETCPQNQWGSKINQLTGEKGKACQDSKRMAIMPPGQDGRYTNEGADLFQLAVPPASLKDFGGFVRNLAAMPTPAAYNMLVTTVSFDTNVTYPKIVFKPTRWLEADEWAVVSKKYAEDETQRVAGIASAQVMHQAKAPGLTQAPQQQAPQQVAPQQQAPQQAAWGQPAPQQQAPQQQAPQQAAWGQPAPQQAPQQQAPQQQAPQQAAWGQPAPQQVAPQQVAPQQVAPQQVAPQQVAPQQPARERGKPSPGKARRTKEEIEQDRLADEADAARAGAQAAPVAQAAPAAQAAQWGQPAPAPQQAAPQQAAQWGQPAPAPQQAAPTMDPSNPWGGAPGAQQVGAPVQPGVVGGDVGSAFKGWDD